jgi:hypothetical protein
LQTLNLNGFGSKTREAVGSHHLAKHASHPLI